MAGACLKWEELLHFSSDEMVCQHFSYRPIFFCQKLTDNFSEIRAQTKTCISFSYICISKTETFSKEFYVCTGWHQNLQRGRDFVMVISVVVKKNSSHLKHVLPFSHFRCTCVQICPIDKDGYKSKDSGDHHIHMFSNLYSRK